MPPTAAPPAAAPPTRVADVQLDGLDLPQLIALADAVETRLAQLDHHRDDLPAWQLLLLRERIADADRHPDDSVPAQDLICEMRARHAATR